MQKSPSSEWSLSRDEIPWYSGYLAWCIIGYGLLPRLTQLGSGRALWHDESLLAVNAVERGYLALLAPLDYLQVAPPLYMWLLKLSLALGGHNVHAARFPSFVVGVITLVLGWRVARRVLRPAGALLALALLAISQHLIIYAGETKPYAGDAMFTLLAFYLALKWEEHPNDWRWTWGAGALLAVSVWMSYPVVFVIAGVGMVQLLRAAYLRDRTACVRLCTLYGISAASFVLQYVLVIVPNRADESTMAFMRDYWKHGFMPFPPTALYQLRWFRERAFLFFDMPGGFTLQGLALFVFAAGLIALYYRKRAFAAFLLLPLILTLLASGLRLYPFHARTTLFLAPVIMLAVGEGMAWIAGAAHRRARLGTGLVLVVLLMTQPFVRATRTILSPVRHRELDRAMDYVSAHWRPGDRIFLLRIDEFSYRFLAHRYDLPADAFVFQETEADDKRIDIPELEAMEALAKAGGSVWFPMTYDYEPMTGERLALLDQYGVRDHDADFRGASAYHYTFAAPSQ